MAKALLKKQEGDLALVKTPLGDIEWEITKIWYSKALI
jgi:transcription elongation GreA/GreB family factor